MNARAIVVLFLVLTLALAPVLVFAPTARGQSQYTERLDVYTAGTDAYWLMTFDKLNASIPALTTAEAGATGVTGYRLLALTSQSEIGNYQIFGPDGYNVLGIPYMPTQGLFLLVNASSSSDAATLLTYFDTKFGTDFTSVSNSSGTSVFFAPASFGATAAPLLYQMVPTNEGGFSQFVSESTLLGLAMPMLELTGSYNGTGFTNTVVMGGATNSLLGSGNVVDLSEIIGSTNATITSSAKSSSSLVVIHSLDGIVVSSDTDATVTNDDATMTGSYSLPVAAGANVDINATLESEPDTALAYRILDHGALSANGTLAITIEIKNTASVGTLENVTVDDNWWQSYPSVFQLSKGNYSFTIPTIASGTNVNESYVLNVVSSVAQEVTIPSTPVTYTYDLSTTTLHGTVGLGEDSVELNSVGPAISILATSSAQTGTSLGTKANYTVSVINDGNSPAFGLKLDNYTESSLSQGSSYTFTIPVSLDGLTQTNYSRAFSLEYSNSAGQTQNVIANSLKLVLSHNSMVIPFVSVTTNDNLTASSISTRTLDVNYTFTNANTAVVAAVSATETLPTGVHCIVVTGQGSCTGNTLTIGIPTLSTNASVTEVELNFTQNNFDIPAVAMTSTYDGLSLHTTGLDYVIPAGLSVTKAFSPDSGFPGTKSQITVGLTNVGTTTIYNATVTSLTDPFDSGPTGTTEQTYPTVASQQSESFNYSVTLTSGSLGNTTSAPVSVSFIFAGSSQEVELGASSVVVFKPVEAIVSSTPLNPEENHDFTLAVTILNPSTVNVTDIVYTLTLPSGVTVLSGGSFSDHVVTVSVPSLAPSSNSTVDLRLSSNTGLTIDTSNSHLTFEYQGNSLSGTAPTLKVLVSVDTTTRYTLPIAVAVVVALVAVIYVRRRVGSVAAP